MVKCCANKIMNRDFCKIDLINIIHPLIFIVGYRIGAAQKEVR